MKSPTCVLIIAVVVIVIIFGIWLLGLGASFEPSLPEFPPRAEPITTEHGLSQAQESVSNELANLSSDLQGIRDALK